MDFIKETLQTAFSSESVPVDASVSCVIVGCFVVFVILASVFIFDDTK